MPPSPPSHRRYALSVSWCLDALLRHLLSVEQDLAAVDRHRRHCRIDGEESLAVAAAPRSRLGSLAASIAAASSDDAHGHGHDDGHGGGGDHGGDGRLAPLDPPPEEWPSHGAVSFAGVALRYRPELPLALRDISFALAPGEHAGVVGRSGSGKSSLVAALLRLVEPEAGRVCIDGLDVRRVRLRELRSRLGVVLQVLLPPSTRPFGCFCPSLQPSGASAPPFGCAYPPLICAAAGAGALLG